MECPVCLEFVRLKNARALTCGHLYCAACAAKLQGVCAVCRKVSLAAPFRIYANFLPCDSVTNDKIYAYALLQGLSLCDYDTCHEVTRKYALNARTVRDICDRQVRLNNANALVFLLQNVAMSAADAAAHAHKAAVLGLEDVARAVCHAPSKHQPAIRQAIVRGCVESDRMDLCLAFVHGFERYAAEVASSNGKWDIVRAVLRRGVARYDILMDALCRNDSAFCAIVAHEFPEEDLCSVVWDNLIDWSTPRLNDTIVNLLQARSQ